MDIVSQEKRSNMMAAIGRSATKPELQVRQYLHACGLRFTLNDTRYPGSPDLVFPRHRVAVFVHGCFWHRHPECRSAATPRTRADFWQKKFERNVARDKKCESDLVALGFTVLVVWECETRAMDALDRLFWTILATSKADGELEGFKSTRSKGAHRTGALRA